MKNALSIFSFCLLFSLSLLDSPVDAHAALKLNCPAAGRIKADKGDGILGTWLTSSGDGKVEIYKTGKSFFGKVAYVRRKNADGSAVLDEHNPDPAKRSHTIFGLEILKNFTYDGSEYWEGGTIYDPKSGRTYSCKISLQSDGSLKVRGYIGVSLFGRTEVWKRP